MEIKNGRQLVLGIVILVLAIIVVISSGVFRSGASPLESTATCAAGTYTVSVFSARVRATASTLSRQVTSLSSGASVQVNGAEQGDPVGGNTLWCEVTVNGRVGYIHSSLITSGGSSASPSGGATNNLSTGSPTIPTATPVPGQPSAPQPPPPLPKPTVSTGYQCNGMDDLNCSNFSSRAAAQAHYNMCGNEDRLDGNDNDGLACESLP